jgi:hypothetical protein
LVPWFAQQVPEQHEHGLTVVESRHARRFDCRTSWDAVHPTLSIPLFSDLWPSRGYEGMAYEAMLFPVKRFHVKLSDRHLGT